MEHIAAWNDALVKYQRRTECIRLCPVDGKNSDEWSFTIGVRHWGSDRARGHKLRYDTLGWGEFGLYEYRRHA